MSLQTGNWIPGQADVSLTDIENLKVPRRRVKTGRCSGRTCSYLERVHDCRALITMLILSGHLRILDMYMDVNMLSASLIPLGVASTIHIPGPFEKKLPAEAVKTFTSLAEDPAAF